MRNSSRRRSRLGPAVAAATIVFLVSTRTASAQQARTADDSGLAVQAAVTAFEGYNQAISAGNYSALRDRYLHAPFVVVDDMPRVIPNVEAVLDGLRRTRESFLAAGYGTPTISAPRVSRLDRDRLLLNYRLSRRKPDGSALSERANFYLMVNVAGTWKVAGIIVQDPIYFEKEK